MSTSATKEGRVGLASGLALIAFHTLVKFAWLLMPTGLLLTNPLANLEIFSQVSSNLTFWKNVTGEALNLPLWLLQYSYFFGIFSALAWLVVLVILALRKSYALNLLFAFAAFSIVHSLSVYLLFGLVSIRWPTVLFYLALFLIFTRQAVKNEFTNSHA
jgi:hypothetical protein